jgi:hypothetical protein
MRWLGWAGIIAGLLWLMLAIVGWIAAEATGAGARGGEASASWAMAIAMLGPLCSLIAMAFLHFRYGPILTVRNVAGDYAWVRGAHPKFLERLPSWDR